MRVDDVGKRGETCAHVDNGWIRAPRGFGCRHHHYSLAHVGFRRARTGRPTGRLFRSRPQSDPRSDQKDNR